MLGQNHTGMDSRLGLAFDVSCGAQVTRAKEKWRRSPPCEPGEARRLQSLLVCARYNLEARLSLGWLNEAGAESGGAVPLSGARRLDTAPL